MSGDRKVSAAVQLGSIFRAVAEIDNEAVSKMVGDVGFPYRFEAALVLQMKAMLEQQGFSSADAPRLEGGES